MIDQAFWSDPDIEGSKSGIKLSALWLITNSQTSLLGICGASAVRFKFETGLPPEALDTTIKALPRAFKRFGAVVFVRNYVRHQFGTGEKLVRNNFFVALKSLFLSIKDEALRDFVLKEYPEFQQALTKGLEGLTKPKDVQGREGKESSAGWKKPTLEEVMTYGDEIKMSQCEVAAWYDHFESNGWRVSGKTPMKDWKAGLRNGKRNAPNFKPNGHKEVAPMPRLSDFEK